MIILEAERGYDAGWLRQALLTMRIFPLIPYRKIKGRHVSETKEICDIFHLTKKRWKVERAFACLKDVVDACLCDGKDSRNFGLDLQPCG